MRLDQLLVTGAPGDAITTAALDIRRLLRSIGPSEIYARNIHPELVGEVLPLERYGERPRPSEDVLIYHASIGEPQVHEFVMQCRQRLVLIYHNISPSPPFVPFDPRFAALLDEGRRELAELRDRVACALAVSEFNAAELVAIGFADVRVSPLLVDVARLRQLPPDAETTVRLTEWDGPTLLFVGQLLPHKRPDLLVQAFHILQTYLVPEARLALVGPNRLPGYHQAVARLVAELQLDRVVLVGAVTAEQLVAYYRRADLFVTASEHEGFCVPLVEAMAFDTPVIARDHGAVAETLGGAGLLLPPNAGPMLVAEAMTALLEDAPYRAELAALGAARLAAFDPERAGATLLDHLLDVAPVRP